MKTKFFFLMAAFMVVSIVKAQLPEGMVSLLPSGVNGNIDDWRKTTQYKNLVVAGSPTRGYQAFFTAVEDTHGEELWATDGTPEGTRMVKDINPGSATSSINWMERFNDKVVFAADDGTHGMQLWISDGTAEGTFMIKQIHEFGDASPRGFVQVNEDQFIFGAKDFDSESYSSRGHQWWLWVSDGTEDGTKMIYECDTRYVGQDYASWTSPWIRVGRKVFFKADNKDGTVGEELWITDGTTEGTHFVKDINTEEIATGTANSAIDNMVNFYNEKLFLKAFSIESNNEPWASDGTPEGTYQIFDSNPTFEDNGFPRGGGASDAGTFPYNGKIYFRGYNEDAGCELACTNLEPGDFKIFDMKPDKTIDNGNTWADIGCTFDGVYMFCANTGFDPLKPTCLGGELHYTNGETITMQSDLSPGTGSNWAKELTVISGSMYFVNDAPLTDNPQLCGKLFRIDNKDQFPVQITDLLPNGDRICALRNLNGDVIFFSFMNKQLYRYHYRKAGYDPAKDKEDMELEYRTRGEIVGLEAMTSPNAITLYPNPTSSVVSFDLSGSVHSLIVRDITGKPVLATNSVLSNRLDVSSFVPGVYVVLIITSEGNYNGKFIVK